MSQVLSKGFVGGDFLITEGDHPAYVREQKTVSNSSGEEMVLSAGYPMDDNVPVVDGQEANTDGLLIEKVVIPDGESRKVAVLARGPATINRDALPTTDYTGDAFNVGTIATALGNLSPKVIVRREPTTQEIQTT
jgi:hypothetical protein